MSSESISNLTGMMETFRVVILILIPLYAIAFLAIKRGLKEGMDWTSELLFIYPKSVQINPYNLLGLIPLWIVLKLLNPILLFAVIVLTIVSVIFYLAQMNSDEEESAIDRDLRGVVLKRDRKNLPKRKVRLEKITTEKEYVETGEIGTDTDVEWKWSVKNILTKTGIIRKPVDEVPKKRKSDVQEKNDAGELTSETSRVAVAETVPEVSLSDLIEKSKSKKDKKKRREVEIKDPGASIINNITNVKFYRKPLIEQEEEYTIFNMDSQEKYKAISGKLLQQLLDYTGKWDESFNNHDMYFVSGIDPYNEHELTTELVTFIKDVLEMDDEVQLRWVYRTPL